MKKMILLWLCLLMSTLGCACSLGYDAMIFTDSSTDPNGVLNAIQSKDADSLIALFSANTIHEVDTWDNSVEELFRYFDGNVVSYDDWGGPIVDTTKEYGQVLRIVESTFDVKTTEEEYRITIQEVAEDTTNKNNIGIHSLYIIKMSEDTDPECAYWGDGKYTPGIHIGIPSPED